VVPPDRFELSTSSLPMTHSAISRRFPRLQASLKTAYFQCIDFPVDTLRFPVFAPA